MKKFLPLFALIAALVISGCGKKADEKTVSTVNPFTDYESLTEAETASGLNFAELPTLEGYDTMVYRAAENELLEIIYTDEKGKHEGMRIRKAKGSADISGDYTEYENQTDVLFNNFTATIKGTPELAKCVTWTETVNNEFYSYAIDVGEAELTYEQVSAFVNQMSTAAHIIPEPEVTPEPETTAAAAGGTIDGAEISEELAGSSFTKVEKSMKVKADVLNVREYPVNVVPEAEVLTQIEQDDTVQVVYENDEWSGFYVTVNDEQRLGWVKSEYLTEG